MPAINTVLFDLDGTLIDTAPDMAHALNLLLKEENKPLIEFKNIRPMVSNGSAALVQLGFPEIENAQTIARLKQRYLEIYQRSLCQHSVLFPGMAELIDYIEQKKMNWGVVTNKPGWLTEPLMKQLKLTPRAACIISGDSTANRKPHPEPMHLACRLANTLAEHCIYVGDAQRDIQAGINAGMKTVVAGYGYIDDDENIADWGADHTINAPCELRQFI
ncbi:Similar to phosphoglycolate phosphatase, clustered with ubiquinone biosynthesis SAM-dependent O-methyltransferase [hydrothermal vent metagenome]|uniref:Similar to phosphoglycolate phosphatase, clustered with ubiquinone biosynthesis SAM-dependent O-methyltransferase n=1 Tax=hydrothermal vent metagenome TaxID=652676 RepID=A0A3B0YPW3_9ZZZZ